MLTIEDTRFAWQRDSSSIETEAALDGVYVIRTAVAAEVMNAPQVVRHYKGVGRGRARAFRSLKTVDLKIRPIHHRLEHRVRAHIFLCMLAYYVEWHLRQVWRELLFADEEQAAKAERDPVAPARRSVSADQKASGHTLADGSPCIACAPCLTNWPHKCAIPAAPRSIRCADLPAHYPAQPDPAPRSGACRNDLTVTETEPRDGAEYRVNAGKCSPQVPQLNA